MKSKITLKIALVLSITILSLMSSASTTQAQPQLRRIADTGIVTLGPNQILRLTVVGTGFGNNPDNLCFRQVEYGEGTCNSDGVCKHAISSQIESAMIPLVQGEGASFDIPRTAFGVRGVVLSNNRNTRVTAMIINSDTGEVMVTYEIFRFEGLPGDVDF